MDVKSNKIRLNSDEIKLIALFESMTKASVKDCIQGEDFMGFIVGEGDMGLAIGKKGSNVERVRNSLGKPVFVVEYSETPEGMVKNLFHPVEIKRLTLGSGENNTATILVSRNDRGKVIGPGGVKIRFAKAVLKRYWDVGNIMIKETA